MKVELNPLLKKFSGKIGDMVFYELNGQPVARRQGKFKDKRSPAQLAHRDRIRHAAAWSRRTMANPKLKAEYQAACQGHQTPFNLGIRDFMTPPEIRSIELGAYTGAVGQPLRFEVWDDFKVKQVSVAIRDAAGALLEEGLADQEAGPNWWAYIARTPAASGQSVLIEVTALDGPGNQAQVSRWQFLPAS